MIQKGDIICVKGDNIYDKAIMWATGTPICHVAIGLDDSTVWQSQLGMGVGKAPMDFKQYVVVRRKGLTPAQEDRIIGFCQANEGVRYAKVSILGYFLKYKLGWDIIIDQKQGFTCNQLVDRAYRHSFIDIFGEDSITGDDIPYSFLEVALRHPEAYEIVFSSVPGISATPSV